MEFFIDFFNLLGEDLLRVVDDVHLIGKVIGSMNTNFLMLISKVDYPTSFTYFCLISLCNSVYKIVSKVIPLHLNPILPSYLSKDKCGFLQGHRIHEAIGSTQEIIHTIKTKHLPVNFLKVFLSKEYDKVSWLYLHLSLIQLVFTLPLA